MAMQVATLSGPPTGIADDAVEAFGAGLRGSAFTASDPGYAAVRPEFNAMHDGEPALVASCTGTADVVDAVNFARDNGLIAAIRGGGHSVAGLSSTDGGMLIDLALMRGVQVDPERRLARVQGGALWGDVDRETQAFGLVAPGGVVSDTGVAGLTLGGGYGWVRRKHGLSCDHLVEAQVVDRGRRRCARHRRNPTRTSSGRSAAAAATSASSLRSRSPSSRSGPIGRRSPRPSTRSRRPPTSCAAGATTWTRRRTRSPSVVRHDHVPCQPGDAGGRARSRGGASSAACTAATRRRVCEAMQPLRELGTVAVRHVGADAVRRGAGRLRPAVPAQPAPARTGSRSTSTRCPTRRSTRSRTGRTTARPRSRW